MKLLTKADSLLQQTLSKKDIIDEGVRIAKSVDGLRQEMLSLQQQKELFIKSNQDILNSELSGLLKEKELLLAELKQIREERLRLLEPLDKEWAEVRSKQEQIDVAIIDLDRKYEELIQKIDDTEAIKQKQLDELQRIETQKQLLISLVDDINTKGISSALLLNEISEMYDDVQEYCISKKSIIDNLERKLTYDIQHNKDFKKNLLQKERELALRERKLIRKN